MAIYQGFMTMREEKVFCHSRSAQVVSELHTIIQDCHGVLYDHVYPAEEVSYFPAPAHGGRPTKTVNVRPLPPPQQVQYYPYPNMDQNHVPPPHHQIRRPVKMAEVPAQKPHQIKGGVLTSTEAAKIYGGVLIVEHGNKKYPRPN
ncbi:uncharacterized protein Pyn_35943 [Prunus yedoensis var. nudiflora]|uniref:Uncharacterized protein n=1 Tax=Prunus yedoensis var. nudiflora TaxID=2094558 RepID=A0A314YK82_PRUYE|nr:uncharacterized protein Pyn_35943 [Prunus yedoensis var. nudiflora]